MTEQKKVDRAGAGAAEISHIAAAPTPALRRRQTAARKQEAVLRVLGAASGRKLFREDQGIQKYRHTLRQNRLQLCHKLELGGSSDRIKMSGHRPQLSPSTQTRFSKMHSANP